MFKIKYSLIIFLFFSKLSFANISNKVDSLRSLLSTNNQDTTYVINAITLGGLFQSSYLDSTYHYANIALAASRKINFLKGEIYSLNLVGVVYLKLGNSSKALQIFLDALILSEKINLPKAIGTIETNIGDLYTKQGDYRKGLDYTFRAIEMFKSINNFDNISVAYINIGNQYEALNMLDSARIYTQLGYEVAQKVDNHNYMGMSQNNLGNIFSKTKEYELAKAYYRSSIQIFIETEDAEGLCESYLGLAKVFRATGNMDSCIYYGRKSYDNATAKNFTKYIYDGAIFIQEHYDLTNNIDSAYVYLKATIAAKETLFSEEKIKQVQNLTIGETLRQQEIADEKEKLLEERKHNLQYIAIGAFIFLCSLFIIIGSQQRIKSSTINFMVTVVLLLTFEFISLFMHPYISVWTHHSPIYMLLILVSLASILVPLHHKLEFWIKDRISHRIIHPKSIRITSKKVE